MTLIRVWQHFFGCFEPEVRSAILQILREEGVETYQFDHFEDGHPGVVFFDEADESLIEFLRTTGKQKSQRVIAVAVSRPELTNSLVWGLLHAGASDVLTWSEPQLAAQQMAGRFQRWQGIQEVINSPLVSRNLAGESRAWLNSLRQVVEVAMFTDGSVLLTGESGTGKELIARLIHTLDPNRSSSNLVVVDCTTIVPELSGSEFFGHERGAFTGAVAPRDGAFAIADGGTLFLDEVGELPLTLQAELLRVVQERTYKRVGSNKWQKTDFRLICATNRDLLEQERRGEFRRDFYHRIATWTCQLPPLRDRVEDILPLTRHFLQKLCRNTTAPELDGVVRDYLLQRDYPGNVRELLQLVTRIACRYQGGGRITAGDIPESERPNYNGDFEDWRDENFERSIRRALSLGASLKSITDAAMETAEELAFREADDNNARAAQKLGINERTLQMHRAARRQKPGQVT